MIHTSLRESRPHEARLGSQAASFDALVTNTGQARDTRLREHRPHTSLASQRDRGFDAVDYSLIHHTRPEVRYAFPRSRVRTSAGRQFRLSCNRVARCEEVLPLHGPRDAICDHKQGSNAFVGGRRSLFRLWDRELFIELVN